MHHTPSRSDANVDLVLETKRSAAAVCTVLIVTSTAKHWRIEGNEITHSRKLPRTENPFASPMHSKYLAQEKADRVLEPFEDL